MNGRWLKRSTWGLSDSASCILTFWFFFRKIFKPSLELKLTKSKATISHDWDTNIIVYPTWSRYFLFIITQLNPIPARGILFLCTCIHYQYIWVLICFESYVPSITTITNPTLARILTLKYIHHQEAAIFYDKERGNIVIRCAWWRSMKAPRLPWNLAHVDVCNLKRKSEDATCQGHDKMTFEKRTLLQVTIWYFWSTIGMFHIW